MSLVSFNISVYFDLIMFFRWQVPEVITYNKTRKMSRHLAVTILLRRLTAPVRWCDLKEEFQLQSNLLSGAYVQIIRWVLVFSKPSVPVCCKILDATCCPVSVVWSAEGGAGARGRDWYAWYFLTLTAQARSSLSVSLSLCQCWWSGVASMGGGHQGDGNCVRKCF